MTRAELCRKVISAMDDVLPLPEVITGHEQLKVTIEEVRDLHNRLMELFLEARKTADCDQASLNVQGNFCFRCGRNVAQIAKEQADGRTETT
jgi:hypothetical protein